MRGIRQTTPTRLIGFDFDEPGFDFQDLLDSALVGVGVGVGVVVGEAEAHVGRRWVEEEDVEAVNLERGHVHRQASPTRNSFCLRLWPVPTHSSHIAARSQLAFEGSC